MLHQNLPVTVLVKHFLKPGQEAHFHQWLQSVFEEVKQFPGYLGTDIHQPTALPDEKDRGKDESDHSVYHCVFRFDNEQHLSVWMASEQRKMLVKQLGGITYDSSEVHRYYNVASWAMPEEVYSQKKPPAKWKIMLISYLGLIPHVYFVPTFVQQWLNESHLVTVLISVALVVPFMSLVVMPLLIAFFRRLRFL